MFLNNDIISHMSERTRDWTSLLLPLKDLFRRTANTKEPGNNDFMAANGVTVDLPNEWAWINGAQAIADKIAEVHTTGKPFRGVYNPTTRQFE